MRNVAGEKFYPSALISVRRLPNLFVGLLFITHACLKCPQNDGPELDDAGWVVNLIKQNGPPMLFQ